MRAAVLTGIRQVRLEERPEPQARPGWVVVQVDRPRSAAPTPPVRRPHRHPVPPGARPRLRRTRRERRRGRRRRDRRHAGGGQAVTAVRGLSRVPCGQAAGLPEEEAHGSVVGRLHDREGRRAAGEPHPPAGGRRGLAGVAVGADRGGAQHGRPAADPVGRDRDGARPGPDRARYHAAVRAVGRGAADRHRRAGRAVLGGEGLRGDALHQRGGHRRARRRRRHHGAGRGRRHRDRDLRLPGVVGHVPRPGAQGGQGRAHRLGQRPAAAPRHPDHGEDAHGVRHRRQRRPRAVRARAGAGAHGAARPRTDGHPPVPLDDVAEAFAVAASKSDGAIKVVVEP